jgi:hypothetical protein
MRNMPALALCLLFADSACAQSADAQRQAEALLALRRAGALVSGEGAALRVSLSGIQGAGKLLDSVAVLTDLQALELAGSDVTDASLAKLSGLVKLQSLNLAGTVVTSAGLAHLTKLKGLTELSLFGTRVNDGGVVHLKKLPALRTVIVHQAHVSRAAAADLGKAVPGLTVIGAR